MNAAGSSALLIAHPGHELLVHYWMERAHPLVFVLTDGSGSSGEERRGQSVRIIEAAGASVGSVFALASDRDWYDAVLVGDRGLFDRASSAITEACVGAGVDRIVTDAIEYFNPMHDLCHALARGVSHGVARAGGGEVELLDFPNERPELKTTRPAHALRVPDDAVSRKAAAVASYDALATEVERRTGDADLLRNERLYAVDRGAGWPQEPPEEPFYERFGRQRIGDGRYARLITYREHVRPLSVALAESR